ncbi:hypothetical protein EMIT0158MI4_70102 [Burkholderia ambifaria]
MVQPRHQSDRAPTLASGRLAP